MREPPLNPFREAEVDTQPGEIVMPEIPQRLATPVFEALKEDTVKGNGHNPDVDEQMLKDKEEEEKRQAEEEAELQRMREEAEEAKIPGSGYLFNVKKKHLPEATRLNEREIFTFGVGAVQDAVLDLNRKDSVFDIFASHIFRLKISAGGKGREENIAVRQVDAEEKANAARGALNGI